MSHISFGPWDLKFRGYHTYTDGKTAHFYERYQKGELNKKSAGWVNPSDFEDANP